MHNWQNLTTGLIVDDVPAFECVHRIKYGTGSQHWTSKLGPRNRHLSAKCQR
jgi:hypothetical protein